MTIDCHKFRCPLCSSEEPDPFFEDAKRTYLRCLRCSLVFVPRRYWLSHEAEKAVYDLHENDVLDQDYRLFLSRLSAPLLARLKPNQQGLDFGCGPGPTLSVLFEAQGHEVTLYDPLYYNDPAMLQQTYDFICASEVVEHLRDPHKDFAALFQMLTPGGWLGVMTKLVIDLQAFGKWHYIRDMTHICFYSRRTFEYVAQRFNADLEFAAKDVILLRKYGKIDKTEPLM
jgi:SAM-dependent methyltransferase